MPDWSYGDAGDRYPVQDRDIWGIGGHILACGDLERGDASTLIDRFGQPALTYSDPPWNMGNARAFRTKAGQTMPVGADFESLLDRIIQAASRTTGDVWLEMGKATVDVLSAAIERAGGARIAVYEITYYRKHPARLIRARFAQPPVRGVTWTILGDSPDGLDDDFTPAWVMERCSKPGDFVFDPCTGRGLTPMTAHRLGRRALSMELNPRRLAVAIDKLVKAGAGEPKIVGRLD